MKHKRISAVIIAIVMLFSFITPTSATETSPFAILCETTECLLFKRYSKETTCSRCRATHDCRIHGCRWVFIYTSNLQDVFKMECFFQCGTFLDCETQYCFIIDRNSNTCMFCKKVFNCDEQGYCLPSFHQAQIGSCAICNKCLCETNNNHLLDFSDCPRCGKPANKPPEKPDEPEDDEKPVVETPVSAAVVWGDVNGDGVVNVADALIVLRLAVGHDVPEAKEAALKIITGTRTQVNMGDALAVLKVAVGIN